MDSSQPDDSSKSNYSFYVIIVLILFILFLVYQFVFQNTLLFESKGTRHIPEKNLPVPSTVSEEMQEVIARPLNPLAYFLPRSQKEWKEIVDKIDAIVVTRVLPKLNILFPATVENHPIGGVNTFSVIPTTLLEENKDFLLIGLHGGGYMLFSGHAVLPECLAMAHYSKYKVLAIDYRMPPDHPFPAALDDVIAVYREVIKTQDPKKIGMFGTSAGSGLLLAVILKMQELNLPLPAVLSVGTPWSDLSKTGDTYYTNENIDNVVVTYDGIMEGMVAQYAGQHDLKNPYISPVYGNYTKEFPPSILTTGTRDLFLSNTVRVFRKLRLAGVDAQLQVFEGMSHAFYAEVYDAPESAEAFDEIVKFFNKHLHH